MVQVANSAFVFVLKKGFVGSDDFGILIEACSNARSKSDETFNAICGEKGIAQDGVRLLSDAIHAPGALNQADNRPREIVIYDNGAVLKILSFAEYVGGDHDPKFIVACNAILFFVALWAETPCQPCRIVRISGYGFHL